MKTPSVTHAWRCTCWLSAEPKRWTKETAPSRGRAVAGAVAALVRPCRSAQRPLDLFDEDPREGCDRALAVGEEAAQPLGHGDHPLAHGHWWDDMIDQVCGRLRHASAIARRTDASSLARERHHKSLAAALTSRPRKPEAEDAAFQILTQFLLHLCWDATLLQQPPLELTLQKLTDDLVKRRAFRPPPLVAGQRPREWPAWANRRQWPSNAGGYAGTRGGRAYVITRTLYNSSTVAGHVRCESTCC